jgi:predicted deacylase
MTTLPAPVFEVLPRDLSAYRVGNVGIDYVHRFESGKPGPHVLINALTHGNEFCGMVAATHLLDTGVRPKIGTLTVSFANVEAYESFDTARPFDSRQVVHNLNRIWSAESLEGAEDSPEHRRARTLRPVVAAADHILDIHSTSQDVAPFWVYPAFERNVTAAMAIGRPGVHLVMPDGLGSGIPLIQHGRHGEPAGHGCAMVVECGQHFLRTSSDLAISVANDFLAHFGLVEGTAPEPRIQPQRRYQLMQTIVIKTPEFRFVRPVVGFEVFAKGELIATDGHDEIRAVCDDCTILMPTRMPIVGREGVYLSRPLR